MLNIFGIISLCIGFYCLYAFCNLKFKNELNELLMVPRGTDVKKCKDFVAFRNMIQWPLLILGIVVVFYGFMDLYNTTYGGHDTLFLLSMLASVVMLVVYAAIVASANKKYF